MLFPLPEIRLPFVCLTHPSGLCFLREDLTDFLTQVIFLVKYFPGVMFYYFFQGGNFVYLVVCYHLPPPADCAFRERGSCSYSLLYPPAPGEDLSSGSRNA